MNAEGVNELSDSSFWRKDASARKVELPRAFLRQKMPPSLLSPALLGHDVELLDRRSISEAWKS